MLLSQMPRLKLVSDPGSADIELGVSMNTARCMPGGLVIPNVPYATLVMSFKFDGNSSNAVEFHCEAKATEEETVRTLINQAVEYIRNKPEPVTFIM